ncbi:DUF2380 domain-containing protein [Billgrantia bachuensis]|uniref:DUF2380 domain-containing protein n=1 Tax=Billgrantia bachuensis TaxID=2717286 RepID=A0ABX0PRA7_9GAMM|nr:DUF2380 domain-containing protein [Halomonas bachuensis]NIC05658.1 DUF2380 domain-containing protein [Halomonas bachuensis]
MTPQDKYRRIARGVSFLLLTSTIAMASSIIADTEKTTLALAQFDFQDTSGEVRDQSAEYEARLKSLNETLYGGLAGNQEITFVGLTCEMERCTHRTPGLAALTRQAKTAGARYLLVGEVHKVSTLIGRVRLAVLDLNDNNKFACERLLSYRGDTDEAWQRMAQYTLRHIEESCIPPR